MKNVFLLFVVAALSSSAQQAGPPYGAGITYQVPDSLHAVQWYTEIAVGSGEDGWYKSSFSEGSVALVKKGNKKSILFMLNTAAANTRLVAKGLQADEVAPGTVAWKFDWQMNLVYKLLVTAIVDSAGQAAYYTGYIFLPEKQQWKLLASFTSANGGKYIREPAVEIGSNKKIKALKNRKLTVHQAWVQRSNGSWKELTEAICSSNNIQAGTGTDSGRIFVAGKPFITGIAEQGKRISTSAGNEKPVFSVTNHLDSAAQAAIDKQEIIASVSNAKSDTTGSIHDIYYLVLQDGTGDYVTGTDTVTVNYKGWLLKDGVVFDQTKEKPATFPLNRLIKGWQYGLTKCRTGGRIRIIIPSGLAYSVRSRSKDIPPNSVLVFEVEVIKAKKAG